MIGWEYHGPFDDLPAQSATGGVPQNFSLGSATGISCHRWSMAAAIRKAMRS